MERAVQNITGKSKRRYGETSLTSWTTIEAIEKAPTEPVAPSPPTHEGLDDLEFGDVGRDARFSPGWWIAPGLIGAAIGAASMIWAA
jgi:hypothetical protein